MQCGGVQQSDYLMDGSTGHRDAWTGIYFLCPLPNRVGTYGRPWRCDLKRSPASRCARNSPKIRAVRQPLTWSEGCAALARRLAVQARQWAVGVAASVLLFTAVA